MLLAVACGGLLLWWGSEGGHWSQVLAQQVGGVVVATAVLSVFWGLWGNRALAAEVMATAQLAQDVERAGLAAVSMEYLADEIWREPFLRTSQVVVFAAYANTWTENQRAAVRDLAVKRGGVVKVILPDPDDEATVTFIAHRSAKTNEQVRDKIVGAQEKYQRLLDGAPNAAVFTYQGPMCYAFYRFSHECVLTLYRNVPVKDRVPVITLKGGELLEFVDGEIAAMADKLTLVWGDESVRFK